MSQQSRPRPSGITDALQAEFLDIVNDVMQSLPDCIANAQLCCDRLAGSPLGEAALVPLLYVRGLKNGHGMIDLTYPLRAGFNTDVEKQGSLVRVAQNLVESQTLPVVVVLLSAAWESQEPLNGPRHYLIPEDNPHRCNIAMVMGCALSQEATLARRVIADSPDGRLAFAGEWQISEPGRARSPLLHKLFMAYFARMQRRVETRQEAKPS